MVQVPTFPALASRVPVTADATLSMIDRAARRQISPAGVNVTPPLPLWKTAVPISFSKLLIWRESAGCATFSRREAFTKVFSSATAITDLSCLRSICYSTEVWEGYQTGIGQLHNVTVTLRRCSTVPLSDCGLKSPVSANAN